MVHRKPPDAHSDETGVTHPDPSGDQECPGPCVCLGAVTELFTRGRSPVRALRSPVAARWSGRPPEGGGGGDAREGGLFLGRAPLEAQRRLLKDKLAGVVQDMAACLSCGKHAGDRDSHMVTVGSSSAGLWSSGGYSIDLLLFRMIYVVFRV